MKGIFVFAACNEVLIGKVLIAPFVSNYKEIDVHKDRFERNLKMASMYFYLNW